MERQEARYGRQVGIGKMGQGWEASWHRLHTPSGLCTRPGLALTRSNPLQLPGLGPISEDWIPLFRWRGQMHDTGGDFTGLQPIITTWYCYDAARMSATTATMSTSVSTCLGAIYE